MAEARIGQTELEAHYPPNTVRDVFADNGSRTPGPRLARACQRASRRAESILLRAWPTQSQIDELFAGDEAVVAATCGLAMFYGAEGRVEWSGQGAPFEGLEKRCLSELRDLADGQLRSRAEDKAGANPTIAGNISSPDEPQFMFAPSRSNPRRGGY